MSRSAAGTSPGTRAAHLGPAVRRPLVLDAALAVWDRLFDEIAAAKETVNCETFLCKEGKLTQRLAGALAAKAREGDAFSLRDFHDRVLSLGQLPLRALRRELGSD